MPSLVELRRILAQSADARALAERPGESAETDAKLAELLAPVLGVGRELAEWLVSHEPEGDLSLTTAWHERLVLVEARDAGADLPKPESVRADAEWAARLLAPPAVEWGADSDQDGRRLWVALSTHRQRPEATRL
jgi:hypothetical protein